MTAPEVEPEAPAEPPAADESRAADEPRTTEASAAEGETVAAEAPASETPQRPRRRRWRRIAAGLAIATPVAGAGLWIAVHRIPWMGPAVANGLRAVVGTDNVARLEDFVYAVEDRVNQLWRKD